MSLLYHVFHSAWFETTVLCIVQLGNVSIKAILAMTVHEESTPTCDVADKDNDRIVIFAMNEYTSPHLCVMQYVHIYIVFTEVVGICGVDLIFA